MKAEYTKASHSVSLLIAHIVFTCKYRHPLLKRCGEDMKAIMQKLASESAEKAAKPKAPKKEFEILEMEVDEDHIHILVKYNPVQSIYEIVKTLKQSSTKRIWRKQSDYLLKFLWKEKTFWSDGYFVASTGMTDIDVLTDYIKNQGKEKSALAEARTSAKA
jgi:putative transposase